MLKIGKKLPFIVFFLSLCLFQISLVLIFILAVIIYRTLVSIPLFQNETLRPVAQLIASMSGAMVNLVLIMSLGRVYEKLALRLTTWGKGRKKLIILAAKMKLQPNQTKKC